ncbi:MAG: DUF2927 domain-containing protein [Rhodospirillales bacterium]
MLKKILLTGVMLAVFAAWVPASAGAESPALNARQKALIDKFVDYFDTIVFGSEYDPKAASTIVYKWQGPVRIYLQYAGVKPDPRHREFVKKHIFALRRLTRLPVLLVGKPKVANVKIIFVPRKNMGKLKLPQTTPQYVARLAAPGGCYFVAYKSGPGKKQQGRIHSSIIVVNAERDIAGINHCLLEEMTQSIGFPNDSNKLRPSLFSDEDRLYDFSPVDKVLVRVLYDKRMKMGVPRKEGIETARRIMTEIFYASPGKPGAPANARKPG